MRYRVHYSIENERRSAEVEAKSPQEAMVRFQHTRSGKDDRQYTCRILSVAAEQAVEEMEMEA